MRRGGSFRWPPTSTGYPWKTCRAPSSRRSSSASRATTAGTGRATRCCERSDSDTTARSGRPPVTTSGRRGSSTPGMARATSCATRPIRQELRVHGLDLRPEYQRWHGPDATADTRPDPNADTDTDTRSGDRHGRDDHAVDQDPRAPVIRGWDCPALYLVETHRRRRDAGSVPAPAVDRRRILRTSRSTRPLRRPRWSL